MLSEKVDLVCACPRSLLRNTVGRLTQQGFKAMAGIEYEFCSPSQTRFLNQIDHFNETAHTLADKRGHDLVVKISFPIIEIADRIAAFDAGNARLLNATTSLKPKILL